MYPAPRALERTPTHGNSAYKVSCPIIETDYVLLSGSDEDFVCRWIVERRVTGEIERRTMESKRETNTSSHTSMLMEGERVWETRKVVRECGRWRESSE